MKRFLAAQLIVVACLFHAAFGWAQSPVLPGPGLPVASGVTPATATFVASVVENAGTTTATFNAAAIGTASANRVIAIIAMCRAGTNGNLPTGVTFGGNAGTHVALSPGDNVTGNVMSTDIWYFADGGSLGTTANIVVTWTSANTRSGISTYAITTSNPSSVVGSGAGSSTTANTLTPTAVTIPSNGVGIAGVLTQNGPGSQTTTFTAGATLDSSSSMSASNAFAVGHTTATGSVSVTGSSTPVANFMAMSLAAWGP